jgi:outer membrane protein TolC
MPRPEPNGTPPGRLAGESAAEDPIDLGKALYLAGVDNPTINLAREQVREALADQLAARSLLLPSINLGGNLRLHYEAFQDDPGFLRFPDLQSLYLGAGARAIGAGTVAIPGLWLYAHLGDALYEPRAARQRVAARTSDARAVQNIILLNVATAYLELVGAEARLEILRRAESDVNEIVRITTAFATAGEGAPADANRAAANAELIRRQLREAEGGIAVASARLSRLLSFDPSVRLRTPGGPVELFRLVPEDSNPETLVTAAIRARPEVTARVAAIDEAQTRVRQEQVRPWVPLLSVGYSGAWFGGGSNQVEPGFGPLKPRSDFDVIAVWGFQNFGAGNHARVWGARAVFGQAVADYEAAVNQIRREVAEAQAAAKTAAGQAEVAKSALTAAEEGFRLETDRVRQGQGRPIEALDSFRQLLDARQELLRAIVAFDIAQFQLLAAVGSNPASGNRTNHESHE